MKTKRDSVRAALWVAVLLGGAFWLLSGKHSAAYVCPDCAMIRDRDSFDAAFIGEVAVIFDRATDTPLSVAAVRVGLVDPPSHTHRWVFSSGELRAVIGGFRSCGRGGGARGAARSDVAAKFLEDCGRWGEREELRDWFELLMKVDAGAILEICGYSAAGFDSGEAFADWYAREAEHVAAALRARR